MPEFVHPFAGLAAERKVTQEELVRAIRFAISAEYEAIQVYMQLAESTDNRLAQAVLKDIADEEIVHAGEFLRLLKELAPEEAALYAEGEAEVEQIAATLAGNTQVAGPSEETMETQTDVTGSEAEDTNPGPKEVQPEVTEKEAEVTASMPEETKSPSPRGIGNLFGKS